MVVSSPYDGSSQVTVAVAGSTSRSAQCLQAILNSRQLQPLWVLTPEPKLVGRKQVLTTNPLAQLAKQQTITAILVSNKLDSTVRTQIQSLPTPDLLLVVDFGYMIPSWLLKHPAIASLNIHPSALPRWRGSSPGQFSLLYGDTHSAVSVIVMNEQLDQGPIVTQLPFSVEPNWTATEYYEHSFYLVSEHLADWLLEFAHGKLSIYEQPLLSPTPIATRLSKESSFVPWELLQTAIKTTRPLQYESAQTQLRQVLQDAWEQSNNLQLTLERAIRAFSPWPRIWTQVPIQTTHKRMQILTAELQQSAFRPLMVHLEGKTPQTWESVREYIR